MSVAALGRTLLKVMSELTDASHDGAENRPISMSMGMTETFRQTAVRFPVTVAEIDKIEFQARPFDQFVQFDNISLVPGKNAGFRVESGRIEPQRRKQ